MATPTKDVTFEGWPKGIDNKSPDVSIAADSLRDAVNVDLDNGGKPRRRRGRTKIIGASGAHSLHAAACGLVYAEGATLKLADVSRAASSTLHSLSSPNRISYEDVNGLTYASNGKDFIVIQPDGVVRDNGVPNPKGQPLVSAVEGFGRLAPGKYLVAVTFVAATGEESGATLPTTAELSATGSLSLTAIPQNNNATAVRIYCSEPGGESLREFATIAIGVLSYSITGPSEGKVLDTAYMERLPAGKIIRYHAGRMYSADGSILAYSEPMRYGLYNPAKDFFQFPEEITIVQPVTDGLYVVADQGYFLRGTDPKEMSLEPKGTAPGIFGTGATLPGSEFDPELNTDVAYWYSSRGATLGLPGGAIRLLTEQAVAMPEYVEGATLMREADGMSHAVTSMRGSGAVSSSAVGDSIEVTVKRNGIIL